MHGDRSDPRTFWERGRTSIPVTAPPRRPVGAPPSSLAAPESRRTPTGPDVSGPTGPPPRVGGAVAALVVAILTLAVPLLGLYMGLWFFVLVANVPGVVLGVKALRRIPDTDEVERYIRYTWVCNLIYTALSVVFLVPLLILTALTLLMGF